MRIRVRLTPSWWRNADPLRGGKLDEAARHELQIAIERRRACIAAMFATWRPVSLLVTGTEFRVSVVFDGERRLCDVADEIARVRAAVRAC